MELKTILTFAMAVSMTVVMAQSASSFTKKIQDSQSTAATANSKAVFSCKGCSCSCKKDASSSCKKNACKKDSSKAATDTTTKK